MNNFLCAFAAAALVALGCSTDTSSLALSPTRADASASGIVPRLRPRVAWLDRRCRDRDRGGRGSPRRARRPTPAGGWPAAIPAAELGLARCGPPPYQMVRLGARDMMGASDTAHLAGVVITLSHCPESRFVTGADGRLMLLVTRDARTWIRFESPGHVPWMMGELLLDDSFPPGPAAGDHDPDQAGVGGGARAAPRRGPGLRGGADGRRRPGRWPADRPRGSR